MPHNAMHLPQCRKQVQRDFSLPILEFFGGSICGIFLGIFGFIHFNFVKIRYALSVSSDLRLC